MEHQELFYFLFRTDPLPEELKSGTNRNKFVTYVESKLSVSHHIQRQLLLSGSQISDYMYFVKKGVARGYYYNEKKNKQHTSFIWTEGTVISDIPSFIRRKPATIYIEVMAGSTLLSLSYNHISDIIRQFPYAEILLNAIILQYSAYQAERSYDLINLSAWERYEKLLHAYPNIELYLSKEIISSFLGITPASALK